MSARRLLVVALLVGCNGSSTEGDDGAGGEKAIPADQVCHLDDQGFSRLVIGCDDSVTGIEVVHAKEEQCIAHVECVRDLGAKCYPGGCEGPCCSDGANACYAASSEAAECE